MPHITIQMIPGRTDAQKQEMALGVQQFLTETYGIGREFISVSIQDVSMERWQEEMAKVPEGTLFVRAGK